jgi:type II secretory pathway component PulK
MATLPTLSEDRRALALASLTIRGDGRINLNEADARVLRAVPGFSEDAVMRIVQHRVTGVPFRSPDDALASLAPGERRAVLARYNEFAHVAITRPTVLVAHATGAAGKGALEATMTVTLVPAGNRVAIVRVESQ